MNMTKNWYFFVSKKSHIFIFKISAKYCFFI